MGEETRRQKLESRNEEGSGGSVIGPADEEGG
jgi:hypothetical protein